MIYDPPVRSGLFRGSRIGWLNISQDKNHGGVRMEDGTIPLEEAMQDAGLDEVEAYILSRQNTVAQ